MQKQIAGFPSCLRIAQTSIICTTERLDLADPRGSLFVQRNHALPLGFSCWNAQPRSPIWIGVQTINGQSTNLITSCSTPARYEESGPLIGTRQGANGRHEPCQLIFWNEAWDTLWHFW